MMIAFVGSGGKTTLLKKMAADFRNQGKSVFVTTTTHMFIEEDTLLTDDADVIIQALQETGYAMAGISEGEKLKALAQKTFELVCTNADVVLVEADGSKHMPLKFPNASEPVIPDSTDEIIVVWGPHGLGRPLSEVCHRPELAMQCLGIGENTIITKDHVRRLLEEGYRIPLKEKFPHAAITVYPPL